ncbi:hypothetical protein [Streptomyces luteolus]|uniref:Uncharacterized protein n=1 Tax=Streptomyces luteolus TaxID=3043615 RepID=A0ABT6T7I0_9ACTN|nr:hypothetical protein [Streptomyces sp. B-S-A12]MDI3423857.1 hypothetical protein [Streptomyces sp. B-S-A12]
MDDRPETVPGCRLSWEVAHVMRMIFDAGTTDAGTTDAGTTDAGTTDAGTTDAGTTDAGTTADGPGTGSHI